ncbi:MAG: hypothetical protein H0Z38_06865 [Firmicutes bacterium]|nr:hypothetical protein [Bacillota bacterium]
MVNGVVIVTHGSAEKTWEDGLGQVLEKAGLPGPGEVTLFQGGYVATTYLKDGAPNLDPWVELLLARGCTKIKLIPLFVSSLSSHVAELAEYARNRQELVMGRALDDHPLIVQLLSQEYSRLVQENQLTETAVILAGHGARGREREWQRWAGALAEQVFLSLNMRPELRRVTYASVYSPDLRTKAEVFWREGWSSLVLPLFLSAGIFTTKVIPDKLKGLPFYLGAPYLPNPLIGRWLVEQVTGFLLDHSRR